MSTYQKKLFLSSILALSCLPLFGQLATQSSWLERNWLRAILYADALDRQCREPQKKLVGVKEVIKDGKPHYEYTYDHVEVFNPKKLPAAATRMYCFDKFAGLFRPAISAVYRPFKWGVEAVAGCSYASPAYFAAPAYVQIPLAVTLHMIKNGLIYATAYPILGALYDKVEKAVTQTSAFKKAYALGQAAVNAVKTRLFGKPPKPASARRLTVHHNQVQHRTAQPSRQETPNRSKVMRIPPMRNGRSTQHTRAKNPHVMQARQKRR